MIKNLLSLSALVAFVSATVVAQTNPKFETWGPTTTASSNPTGWETYNADLLLGTLPIGVTAETVSPGEGLTSVRMETKTGYAAGFGADTLAGIISLNGDLLGNKVIKGIPYTSRPTTVSYKYKNAPVNGDTAVFLVELMQGGQLLGIAGSNLSATVASWTPKTSTFTYLLAGAPDTMIILATSSKDGFYNNTKLAQPGSTFWLDDIVLNFPVGVQQAIYSERVLAYPNPASSSIRFDLNNNKATSIKVTDITGKVVRIVNASSSIVDMDVNEFPAGLYVYQVYNNENLIFTDKFNVVR